MTTSDCKKIKEVVGIGDQNQMSYNSSNSQFLISASHNGGIIFRNNDDLQAQSSWDILPCKEFLESSSSLVVFLLCW